MRGALLRVRRQNWAEARTGLGFARAHVEQAVLVEILNVHLPSALYGTK